MLKPNKILRDIWPSCFTFRIGNNKGTEQTALMRGLVSAFVAGKQRSQVSHVEAQVMVKPRPGYAPEMLYFF